MAPLNLPVGPAGIAVSIQPAVLLNICDAYIRRNDGQARVIGTLLGAVTDGVVDVRNCYAVPHNETNDQARAGSRSLATVLILPLPLLYDQALLLSLLLNCQQRPVRGCLCCAGTCEGPQRRRLCLCCRWLWT